MCTNHCVHHDDTSQWYDSRQVNPVEYHRNIPGIGEITYTIPEEDKINKPSHYTLIAGKGVEVIDVIEAAVSVNGIPATMASHYANTLKYLLRCGRKGCFLEDLKKARFYLDRIIVNTEAKVEGV